MKQVILGMLLHNDELSYQQKILSYKLESMKMFYYQQNNLMDTK